MRNHSGNSPYLEILLGTAILGMLRVYSGFQENEQAQEYDSRRHCSPEHCRPCTISIPAK